MKIRLIYKPYLFLCMSFLSIVGCRKDIIPTRIPANIESKNTITPYNFDWENLDKMPSPIDIPVPWASGANRSFPLVYTTDIKKSDGWELVYNTFDPQTFTQPAYFIIYNRYRGLLRGYFYLNPITPIPSSNISHGLIQDGSNPSPILSYSATEITNLNVHQPISTTVQQYKTSATGTWYSAEFEMAYDPNIGNQISNDNRMIWEVGSVNTTNIVLNGTSQGTIKGTLTQPVSSLSLLGNVISGGLQFGYLNEIDSWNLKSSVATALKTGLQSAFGGTVKNVLNGLFGGASQSTQYANLITSATYTLTGTATDVYQLQNPSLAIPGTQGQDNVDGYSPLYKNPLGVFSLTGVPKANIVVPTNYGDMYTDYYWQSEICTLDHNSYSINFNPSVINSSSSGASIQNLKQEIISFRNYYSRRNVFPQNQSNNTSDTPIPSTASTEDIHDTKVIVDPLSSNYIIPLKLYYVTFNNGYGTVCVPEDDFVGNAPLPTTILRVSFDVVPNNGTPKSTIVKSFNIILSQIDYQSVY